MARVLSKSKCPFTADQRVRAWQSFATASGTIRAGDVLRGDDPIVLEHHPWFELVDTPTAERKNVWAEMPAPPDHRDPAIQIGTNSLANVPRERLVRATSAFWTNQGYAPGSHGEKAELPPTGRGWGISVGQLVEISHPLVAQHPECFEFVQRTVTREDVERLTREIERDAAA